jgi:hypothetical protein
MAENSDEVVVTEYMIGMAVRARDLERLTVWAGQGVRVTSTDPLFVAARIGHLDMVRLLVQQMGANVNQPPGETPLIVAAYCDNTALVRLLVTELGADINHGSLHVGSPLMMAASRGLRAVVQVLVELGAKVGAVNVYGSTALHLSARNGHYLTMQYLLEEGGANMEDVNTNGESAWDLLTEHIKAAPENVFYEDEDSDDEVEAAALIALLRVLVLGGAPPHALVALLSPEPARVVQEGARIRARLPAYLAHRRAYLDLRCPRISLLPGVLRALIYTFEGPATTEELWATGLGQVP